MSMIDFYGGEMLGGARKKTTKASSNPWIKFVEQHKGQGFSLAQLSAMYKGQAVPAKGKKAHRAPAKGKKARSLPSKQKAIENAMYLRERLFPVANSKNPKMKLTMAHLKQMGFDTKKMTKDEKKQLSRFLADKLHGRGVGQDVGNALGSIADSIFGFGGTALGGYPLGGADYMDEMLGHGIGQDVGNALGSVADSIFGFGRRPVHPRVRHAKKRGGFNPMSLAPLALALL